MSSSTSPEVMAIEGLGAIYTDLQHMSAGAEGFDLGALARVTTGNGGERWR
jgi:hypothetical protein